MHKSLLSIVSNSKYYCTLTNWIGPWLVHGERNRALHWMNSLQSLIICIHFYCPAISVWIGALIFILSWHQHQYQQQLQKPRRRDERINERKSSRNSNIKAGVDLNMYFVNCCYFSTFIKIYSIHSDPQLPTSSTVKMLLWRL